MFYKDAERCELKYRSIVFGRYEASSETPYYTSIVCNIPVYSTVMRNIGLIAFIHYKNESAAYTSRKKCRKVNCSKLELFCLMSMSMI